MSASHRSTSSGDFSESINTYEKPAQGDLPGGTSEIIPEAGLPGAEVPGAGVRRTRRRSVSKNVKAPKWVGFAMLSFGLTGLAMIVWGWSLTLSVQHWPVVEGELVSHNARQRTVRHRQRDQTIYAVEVTYRYAVSGQSFQGDRFSTVDIEFSTAQEVTDAVMALKKTNGRYDVFYHPDDPSQAYLMAATDSALTIIELIALTIMGGFVLLIVLVMGGGILLGNRVKISTGEATRSGM